MIDQPPRGPASWAISETETAEHVPLEGMQMPGGYGYATEYGMESLLRSTVVSTAYGARARSSEDLYGVRNICRCGTYPRIREAIRSGAERM